MSTWSSATACATGARCATGSRRDHRPPAPATSCSTATRPRSGYRSAARIATTAVIAGIAAWVSYWHMTGVAARYGETGSAPYLLPFSVDGLIVIASISLVELADRTRTARPSTVDTPRDEPA